MRITGINDGSNPLQRVTDSSASPASPTAAASGAGEAYRITFSDQARLATEAQSAISRLPDVRHAKLSAMRAGLDHGTWTPDSRAVADGILAEGER